MHGGEWLDALRSYIHENKETASQYIEANIPQIRMISSEATYLLWLDISNRISFGTEANGKVGIKLHTGEKHGLRHLLFLC